MHFGFRARSNLPQREQAYQRPGARAQTLKPELGQAPCDEHFLLEDNKYIADVLADFRERKSREMQSKARARACPPPQHVMMV